jgi:hypothetical protein
MIETAIRRVVALPLGVAAQRASRAGLGPNTLILFGFALGLAAFACITAHRPLMGLGLLICNRILAGVGLELDARSAGERRLPLYLYEVFNVLIAVSIPLAFALDVPSRAFATVVLTVGVAVSLTSRLVFDAFVAGGRCAPDDASLVPSGRAGDTTESTLIFVVFALACIVPGWFGVIAYVSGVLCFAMAGARIAVAVETLR